jgi:hypothetical protein
MNSKFVLDINECLVNNGGCEQICRNVPGSNQCTCLSGYRLSNDKKTCEGRKIFRSGYLQALLGHILGILDICEICVMNRNFTYL